LTETFLFPGIARHMVAPLFPVARPIATKELDSSYPLRALPGVQLRHDESQWASVFYREWLAVMRVCKERILAGKVVEGHVCCPAFIVRVNKHVSSGVSDFRAVQNLARGDALPKIVKSRPARHAVKIRLHLHTWQRLELLPSPFHRFFHKSQNFE